MVHFFFCAILAFRFLNVKRIDVCKLHREDPVIRLVVHCEKFLSLSCFGMARPLWLDPTFRRAVRLFQRRFRGRTGWGSITQSIVTLAKMSSLREAKRRSNPQHTQEIASPTRHLSLGACSDMLFIPLQQVPQISIQILEHRDQPIRLLFRRADKFDSLRNHLVVVAPEIIGVEEEKYPPACLIPDEGFLLRLGRFRKEQCCPR